MDYKLGKKKAKIDKRTIQFNKIVKAVLPPIPDIFDVDTLVGVKLDNPVYANDKWGDCVIAGRAHMTRRFEAFEQKTILPITDEEVLIQYWEEGRPRCMLLKWFSPRKPDNGLVMLKSLSNWRRNGWVINGKKYNIYAYAGIDWQNHDEVRAAAYLLTGVYCGIDLPDSAMEQFNHHQVWDTVNNSKIKGGHCVYVKRITPNGPICVTWGAEQRMTWNFWDKYVDECYGIVDNRNKFTVNSPVDVDKLDEYLHEITK